MLQLNCLLINGNVIILDAEINFNFLPQRHVHVMSYHFEMLYLNALFPKKAYLRKMYPIMYLDALTKINDTYKGNTTSNVMFTVSFFNSFSELLLK